MFLIKKKNYLDQKKLIIAPQINSHMWISSLMLLTDLSVHLNELNLKLQGKGKSIDVIFGYIKSFESKLEVFKRDIRDKRFKYFQRTKKFFATSATTSEIESVILFKSILKSLFQSFQDRFNQFRDMEETLRIIKYPDNIDFRTLKLDAFEWLTITDLEMDIL
jgi:hypothetical protein